MPELPEVQTVVDTLSPLLIGRRFRSVEHLRGDIVSPISFDFRSAIFGRRVQDVSRRAKRIVLMLDDGNRFYFHLGMTGRLTIESANAEVAKHTHLIATLDNGRQLRFRDPRRFGGIFWLGEKSVDADLGPEPLTVRPQQLADRLARTQRNIKSALLDQSLIAGLGNIYVDESLFAAGVHPMRIAKDLSRDEILSLSRAIKKVLRKAIRHRGSTLRDYVDANGGAGAFQKLHSVYDRAKQPCRKCRTPIERIVIGGRSTHFCGKCQRGL